MRYHTITAVLAGLTTGCAARKTVAAAPPSLRPARPPVNLALPRISFERVIRTTVGLRPHRDSGFVLKPEKFDSKTVIHDYGFGGAGMSLAWGCGAMAADMALEHPERRAAVLGCGSPGLTAARQLQRRGFDVTIYAMTVPPDTTSNMSYAGFTPTTALIANEKRTPAWDEQFRKAAEISYRQLQLLAVAHQHRRPAHRGDSLGEWKRRRFFRRRGEPCEFSRRKAHRQRQRLHRYSAIGRTDGRIRKSKSHSCRGVGAGRRSLTSRSARGFQLATAMTFLIPPDLPAKGSAA